MYYLAYVLIGVLGLITCAIVCAVAVDAFATGRDWLRRRSRERKLIADHRTQDPSP
jgi:hypothetical protein